MMVASALAFTSAIPVPGTISVGNAMNSEVAVTAGSGSTLGGSGGDVSSSGSAINGFFNANGATVNGSVEVNNVANSKTDVAAGNGYAGGSGGDVNSAGQAINNGVTGSWSSVFGNLNVGNAVSNKLTATAGSGGFFGYEGGSLNTVGASNGNTVQATGNQKNGTVINGAVGVTQNVNASVAGGNAGNIGAGGDINSSGTGLGNNVKV
jgi:hypothetical protein